MLTGLHAFETVSGVDAVLRENSNFDALDFHSRNAYRVAIEKIARRSGKSEHDITQAALELAHKSAEADRRRRRGSRAAQTRRRLLPCRRWAARSLRQLASYPADAVFCVGCGSTAILALPDLWVPASILFDRISLYWSITG